MSLWKFLFLNPVVVSYLHYSVLFFRNIFSKKCIKDLVVWWKGCNFALAFRRKGLRMRLLDGCSAVETKKFVKNRIKIWPCRKKVLTLQSVSEKKSKREDIERITID